MKGLARDALELLSEPAQGQRLSPKQADCPQPQQSQGVGQLFFTLTMNLTPHSRGSQLLTASTKSLGSSWLVFQKPKIVPAKMLITRRNPRD